MRQLLLLSLSLFTACQLAGINCTEMGCGGSLSLLLSERL
jgi:hypothetical protein